MTDLPWLAAYLYRDEPWEPLLTRAVKPFVAEVLQQGLADGYFFIRYWERGPHIRLRFTGDPKKMDRDLKPRIDAHFGRFFEENPSEREEPEWTKNLPEDQTWLPNNSIQYIDYEPELKRYGGLVGMPIAEQLFQASSDAILEILSQADSWDYNRALGIAIQMHLAFAHAFGMKLPELKAFFRMVAKGWMGRAYYHDENTTPEEHRERLDETREAFKKAFSEQEQILIPFCDTLWNAFSEGAVFEQEWLNLWLAALKETATALSRNAEKIETYESPWVVNGDHPELQAISQDRIGFLPILESYIHMTNNRLGILNRDEAFLGYLIENTMSKL